MGRPRRQAASSVNYSSFFKEKDDIKSGKDETSSGGKDPSSSDEDIEDTCGTISHSSDQEAQPSGADNIEDKAAGHGIVEEMEELTCKSRRRTSRSTRKNYKDTDSSADGMDLTESDHNGVATKWQFKRRLYPKREITPVTINDDSDCSMGSASDGPESVDSERFGKGKMASGRQVRKQGQKRTMFRAEQLPPEFGKSKSSTFRELVSAGTFPNRESKGSLRKKPPPLASFKKPGDRDITSRVSLCSSGEDDIPTRQKRKSKRLVLPSDDDDESDDGRSTSQEGHGATEDEDVDSHRLTKVQEREEEGIRKKPRAYQPRYDGEIEKILLFRISESNVKELLVKIRGKSYRRLKWLPFPAVERHKSQTLKCFLTKGGMKLSAEDVIDKSWTLVDRILDQRCTYGGGPEYYVKWQGLPYSESTWEAEDSLVNDKDHIVRFKKYNNPLKTSRTVTTTEKIPSFQNDRILRDYQIEGFKWMVLRYEQGLGCILGDEMGLGKTAQSIAVLEYIRQVRGSQGPFLVIAPLTTLAHWQREVEVWTDMYTVLYHGTKEDRDVIESTEFFMRHSGKKDRQCKFNVLIMAYDTLRRASRMFWNITWEAVIVDEAHKLKSTKSQMRGLVADLPHKWLLLLTGTPIQNNLAELFSLMNLLDPFNYECLDEFLENFGGDPPTVQQVQALQEALKPLLLRRMKEDVETLPMKDEILLKCPLTPKQHVYYKALYEGKIKCLLQGSGTSNLPGLRNLSMELRKVCNHPFLCNGVEEDAVARHYKLSSAPLDELDMLVNSSGKLYVMSQLLEKLKREGHKVLVFSQFKIMLDILEDFFRLKQYGFERIDGNTVHQDRQTAIDRFTKENEEVFVFLLSTRAGGSGITLTAADTVIIYDSDWNPQNDLQAMARCHRIGQDREVMVYRMITWDTYEQQLFECASRKYGLEEAVLGKYDPSDPQNNSRKIFDLLKNGAHVLSSAEGKGFVAEDIDEILKNRSEKRQIGSRAGNTFSEVTFTVNAHENRDYWTSLLPQAVAATRAVAPSPMGKRRMKRRVNYSEGRKTKDSDTDASQGFACEQEGSDDSTSCENEETEVVVEKLSIRTQKWSCKVFNKFLEAYLAFGPRRWTVVVRKPYNSCLLDKPAYEIDEACACVQDILRRYHSSVLESQNESPPLHVEDPIVGSVPLHPSLTTEADEARLRGILSGMKLPDFLDIAIESKGTIRLFATKGPLFWNHAKAIEEVGKVVQALRENPDSDEARIPYNGVLTETQKFKKHQDISILKGIYEHGYSCWHPGIFIDLMLEDATLELHDLTQSEITAEIARRDHRARGPEGDAAVPDLERTRLLQQKRSATRSQLAKRIRQILHALVTPPSMLVDTINKLNVPPPEKAPTMVQKSPSRLIPMLNDKEEAQNRCDAQTAKAAFDKLFKQRKSSSTDDATKSSKQVVNVDMSNLNLNCQSQVKTSCPEEKPLSSPRLAHATGTVAGDQPDHSPQIIADAKNGSIQPSTGKESICTPSPTQPGKYILLSSKRKLGTLDDSGGRTFKAMKESIETTPIRARKSERDDL